MPVIGHGTEICTSTTRPSTAAEGLMIYETDTNKILVNSSATSTPSWVEVSDLDSSYGLTDGFYSAVKNVVQGSDSTATTITSTTMTDIGLSVSITPSSATNKVLVMAWVPVQSFRETDTNNGGLRLVRGSTAITAAAGVMNGSTGGTVAGLTASRSVITLMYLDSPATTSSTTYKVQGQVDIAANNSSLIAQIQNTPSYIIAMEVVV